MAVEPCACPYCDKQIEPRPRRGRRCPHCRQAFLVRHGQLLKVEGGAPAEDRARRRFLRFEVFRSGLSSWESLFEKAAVFASRVGPERILSVSQSEDGNEGLVTVWYWAEADWNAAREPEES